jgi:hypothetical protein
VVGVRYYDGDRPRIAVGHVGKDGILAGVPYHVVDGRLTEKKEG